MSFIRGLTSRFTSLSAAERRTIRLALILLVPALLYVYGFRPWRASITSMRDQLATEVTTLSRERALLATPAAESQVTAAADPLPSTLLFSGRDNVVASADLASAVTTAAHRSRVYLIQAATRPSTVTPEGVRQLRVEMRGESDLQGILTFISEIETGSRLIRFDRIDITKAPGSDSYTDGFETLTFAATLTGFAIDQAATPTGAKQ